MFSLIRNFKFLIQSWKKYFEPKEAVCSKLKVTTGLGPDIEKLQKQLRGEVRDEFQKKVLNADRSRLLEADYVEPPYVLYPWVNPFP